MTLSPIKDELASIPGIEDLEITIREGKPPLARVWLDGSRSSEEVRERIDALLGSAIPKPDIVEPATPTRRSGLGKGLDSLIPGAGDGAVPTHLRSRRETRGTSIERVAVVEHASGITVEVEDGAGHRFVSDVGTDRSIDRAVLSAVRSMTGVPVEVTFDLGVTQVAGSRVLVVTATMDGRTSAGASVITFGRPFAVADAAHKAVAEF